MGYTLEERPYKQENEIKMHKKIIQDVSTLKNTIPPIIYSRILNSGYILGGCFLSLMSNQQVNDYDIFLDNKEDLNFVKDFFTMCLPKKYKKSGSSFIYARNGISITDRAISIRGKDGVKWQIIVTQYGNPYNLIHGFDFLHTMCIFSIKENRIITMSDFFKHELFPYRTIYLNPDSKVNPIATVKRAIKLASREHVLNNKDFFTLMGKITQSKELKELEDIFLTTMEEY